MERFESEPIGIILVDHGSRLSAANLMLNDVATLYQKVSGRKIVEVAHMELAEPTIAQAFAKCVEQGAKAVVVHPYFLSPGRHSTTDIPKLTKEAADGYPGVGYHVTPPLGLDEFLVQVVEKRVAQCAGNRFDCSYCNERDHCKSRK